MTRAMRGTVTSGRPDDFTLIASLEAGGAPGPTSCPAVIERSWSDGDRILTLTGPAPNHVPAPPSSTVPNPGGSSSTGNGPSTRAITALPATTVTTVANGEVMSPS